MHSRQNCLLYLLYSLFKTYVYFSRTVWPVGRHECKCALYRKALKFASRRDKPQKNALGENMEQKYYYEK